MICLRAIMPLLALASLVAAVHCPPTSNCVVVPSAISFVAGYSEPKEQHTYPEGLEAIFDDNTSGKVEGCGARGSFYFANKDGQRTVSASSPEGSKLLVALADNPPKAGVAGVAFKGPGAVSFQCAP